MDFVSPEKLLVVIVIAIIVFGPKRVPELGRSLGKGIREFKASLDGEHSGGATKSESVELSEPAPSETAGSPGPESAEVGPTRS